MLSGKLIVVTGGAGFVGSRLCARLREGGNRVISLDNHFTGSELERIGGVEYRTGHTRDIATLVPEHPDIVFHLGEYARVEQSVFEPEVVHDLNVVGTRGVIEFWKQEKCKLVYAGSSTKFGDGGAARYTSPYASTKAANTELVKRTGDELGLPYAITYFYNVFGPGERFGTYGTVIEIFKQQYLHGVPLTVVAPGTQRRNFTHVDDIVDGLLLVGERGQGDEFGLGNDESHSIIDVARMFSGDIVMLPKREGNRMGSELHTEKSRSLGWSATRRLGAYIEEFLRAHERGSAREKRVLVFSTTFHPVSGLAEDAFLEVARQMPQIRFDVVTTRFSADGSSAPSPLANVFVHRIGRGHWSDKFLLPFLGYRKAAGLAKRHRFLFTWSIMASYGALAAARVKHSAHLPLLITLADQDIGDLSALKRALIRLIIADADQVYGSEKQEKHAAAISGHALRRHSIGEGDAFANQFRFVYASIIRKHTRA